MILLYILALCIISFLTIKKRNTLLTTNMIFSLMWISGGIGNILGIANLYKIQKKVHLYIFISLIVFNFVYLVLCSNKPLHKLVDIDKISVRQLSYSKCLIVNILAYIFMIPILFKSIPIAISSGMSGVRAEAVEIDSIIMSPFQFRIFSWAIYPIFMTIVLYAFILLVVRKEKRFLTILAVANVVVYLLSLGGRHAIVKGIGYLIFSLLFFNKNEIRLTKKSIKNFFIIVVLFLITYQTTKNRSLQGMTFIGNVYTYFFGSLSYFNIIINDPHFSLYNDELLYGRGVLGFIISPILYIIMNIFNTKNYTAEYLIKLVTNNFVLISDNVKYNAMASSLYIFWRDGRVMGIIVDMALFAIITIYVEKKLVKKQNLRWASIYIFIVFIVFTSTMLYDLLTIQAAANIFFILLLTHNSNKKHKSELD